MKSGKLPVQSYPYPPDYPTALKEIDALRKQLDNVNAKWAKSFERRVLDNRGNKGTINALRKEVSSLKELLKKNGIEQPKVKDAWEL